LAFIKSERLVDKSINRNRLTKMNRINKYPDITRFKMYLSKIRIFPKEYYPD